MSSIILRCKTASGQHTIKQLTSNSTLLELKLVLSDLCDIRQEYLKVLSGYPPKALNLDNDGMQLCDANIKTGDTLTVQEDKNAQVQRKENTFVGDNSRGNLTRKVVPANNSCLFTSVNFVMEGVLDLNCSSSMRELIAGIVMSDPQTYSDSILEKSNPEYCAWIMNDETWGGAIEVSILSQYYQMEIDVVNTQYCRIDRFGEDKNYPERVLLIYDGIHYDSLALEPVDSAKFITKFSTKDEFILCQALEFAAKARANKQFVDVNGFSLRCLICQTALKGQTEAQSHAKDTGHINFGEF